MRESEGAAGATLPAVVAAGGVAAGGRTGPGRGSRLSRRLLSAPSQLVLGCCLLAGALALSHPTRMLPLLGRVGPGSLVAALALNVPVTLLRAWRAALLTRHLAHPVPWRSMLAIQLVGQAASSITPAAGGDLVRAHYWRRRHRLPLPGGVAVVTFERLSSFSLLVALAGLWLLPTGDAGAGWLASLAGLGLALLAGLWLLRPRGPLGSWLAPRLPSLPLVGSRAGGLLAAIGHLRSFSTAPSLLLKTSLLTLVVFAFSALQIWLLLGALGAPVPPLSSLAV